MPLASPKLRDSTPAQRALLELRRNPRKPKKRKVRLWLYPVTISTEMLLEGALIETPDETPARDIRVMVEAEDKLDAAREALAYIQDNLRHGEVFHSLKVGDRE